MLNDAIGQDKTEEEERVPPSADAASGRPGGKKLDADGEFYRDGKRLLGKNAGGQLTKLKQLLGFEEARAVIETARGKDNPAEWVAKVIHRAEAEADEEADFWKRVL